MIITLVKRNDNRVCAICHRKIRKGQIMVSHEEIINSFGNSRMWFGHMGCTIEKLRKIKAKIEDELAKVPDICIVLNRHVTKVK